MKDILRRQASWGFSLPACWSHKNSLWYVLFYYFLIFHYLTNELNTVILPSVPLNTIVFQPKTELNAPCVVRQCTWELLLFPQLVLWSTQLLAATLLLISASQHLKLFKQHTSPLAIDTIIKTQSPHWNQKCSNTCQYHSCTSKSKQINVFDYCLNLWRCSWVEL